VKKYKQVIVALSSLAEMIGSLEESRQNLIYGVYRIDGGMFVIVYTTED
jgi:hypothetical protein